MKKLLFLTALTAALVACSPKAEQAAKVFGRYVPERKDDFAWENEYAAYRLYGPALAAENPSNGVDLWSKNSPALVIDTMYGRELKDGRPYHINYDGNLDCYKVGHTAGCGGLVVMADSVVYVGGHYATWEILEQTATKLVFRLTYDNLIVCEQPFLETLTITCESGKRLNKAEVVLMCPTKIRLPQLYVGGGIYLHDTLDNAFVCEKCGAIAYAEDALSDRQAARMNEEYNGSTTQGRSYEAVITPGATVQGEMDGCLVSLRPYELGDTLTYYFGGGWSEWTDGVDSLATDEDWFAAIKQFAASL